MPEETSTRLVRKFVSVWAWALGRGVVGNRASNAKEIDDAVAKMVAALPGAAAH